MKAYTNKTVFLLTSLISLTGTLLLASCGASSVPATTSPANTGSGANDGATHNNLLGEWIGLGSKNQTLLRLSIASVSENNTVFGKATLPKAVEGSGPYQVTGILNQLADISKFSAEIKKSTLTYYKLDCQSIGSPVVVAAAWNCEMVNVPLPTKGLSNERVSRLKLKKTESK